MSQPIPSSGCDFFEYFGTPNYAGYWWLGYVCWLSPFRIQRSSTDCVFALLVRCCVGSPWLLVFKKYFLFALKTVFSKHQSIVGSHSPVNHCSSARELDGYCSYRSTVLKIGFPSKIFELYRKCFSALGGLCRILIFLHLYSACSFQVLL